MSTTLQTLPEGLPPLPPVPTGKSQWKVERRDLTSDDILNAYIRITDGNEWRHPLAFHASEFPERRDILIAEAVRASDVAPNPHQHPTLPDVRFGVNLEPAEPSLETPICDRERFTIRWDVRNAAYKVNRSCYNGGSVVPVEIAESLEQRAEAAERELAKWQQPHDPELFAELQAQASHGKSLAAYAVYVTALEHALKHAGEAAERRAGVLEDHLRTLIAWGETMWSSRPDAGPSVIERLRECVGDLLRNASADCPQHYIREAEQLLEATKP